MRADGGALLAALIHLSKHAHFLVHYACGKPSGLHSLVGHLLKAPRSGWLCVSFAGVRPDTLLDGYRSPKQLIQRA